MKRSDITDLFPEATDEQIKKLMDINGADVNGVRTQLDAANAALKTAQDAAKAAVSAADYQKAKDRAAELEQELDALKAGNELREMRAVVAKEKGLPADLLTGGTEDECKAQADAILAFAKPVAYPSLPDGGDPAHHNGASTRDQFAAWMENQN